MVGCGGKNEPSVSVSDGKTSPNYSPNNINDTAEKDVALPENKDPAIIDGTAISKEPIEETPELPTEETENPDFTEPEITSAEEAEQPIVEKPDGEPVYYKDLHPEKVESAQVTVDINKSEDYRFSFIRDFSCDDIDEFEEIFQQISTKVQDEAKTFLDIDNARVTPKFFPPSDGELYITRAKDKVNSNITYQISLHVLPNYAGISVDFYFEDFDNVAGRISDILEDYFGIVISEFDIDYAKKTLDNIEITESTTGTSVTSYSRDSELGFSITNDFEHYIFTTGISEYF
jgi:hypothetical protein